MSKFKVRQPIVHLPSFKEYMIYNAELAAKYKELGVEIPFTWSDTWYYHTDREGLMKVISYLVFKSSLYKAERFDCEDYAMKAQVVSAEVLGLNATRYTYGDMPLGAHGFNTHWVGDGFLIFEPNAGFQYDSPVFEWGENGYQPKAVLL